MFKYVIKYVILVNIIQKCAVTRIIFFRSEITHCPIAKSNPFYTWSCIVAMHKLSMLKQTVKIVFCTSQPPPSVSMSQYTSTGFERLLLMKMVKMPLCRLPFFMTWRQSMGKEYKRPTRTDIKKIKLSIHIEGTKDAQQNPCADLSWRWFVLLCSSCFPCRQWWWQYISSPSPDQSPKSWSRQHRAALQLPENKSNVTV